MLSDSWPWFVSATSWVYDAATTNWVLGLTLFVSGCVFYEWVANISLRMDRKSSKYYRWTTKNQAQGVYNILSKNTFLRKFISPEAYIEDFNLRLAHFDLPTIPPEISKDEKTNILYSQYARLVSEGDFGIAQIFHQSVVANLSDETPTAQTSPES
ncbi:hypothetical protein [Ruegeria atlantica]|uniref:hypothetical protein n=1 Tax=Ruegeria atlantica TaxID=81569 RepID=UPI00147BC119|nr:hypothetical protein [Ruegeria atlantica]